MTGRYSSSIYACAAGVSIIALAAPACAQHAEQKIYDLPAQSLGESLRAVAMASGTNVVVSSTLVDGKVAPALSGRFTAIDAITALLRGSGLHVRETESGLIIDRDDRKVAESEGGSDVVVTGTRIPGAKVASQVITVSREDARNAGQATLGEVVRSLPQSFGGGQNPGIGFNVPAINGVDVGGGSSINLRGLGSDATLTLLNGHRLAYSGSRQSVDVSTIPLGALDRIEIVADGASALYGSDAVGGVANIILRPDMDGIETRARLGGATEGGDFQQQYGVTAGTRWTGGGIIAAYEYNRASAIEARERDYAATRSPGLRLLPSTLANNLLVSAHQDLADNLTFSVDGLYNARRTFFVYPQNPAGDLTVSRSEQTTMEKAFVIAPSLSLTLGERTHLNLSGTYAKDRVDYRNVLAIPGSATTLAAGCYCNSAASVELSGDGSLFQLPGGWARLAAGVGYRSTGLRSDRGAGNVQNFDRSESSTYGYAELSLPFLSPDASTGGGMRLNFNAAVRYEHYREFGDVATPKLGLIWSPASAVDFKASWGRSFRAPTLYQRYQPVLLTLFPAATLGGAGLPAGSTALYLQGGSAGLKPERASSWSVTADFHPTALPGFDLQISYFSIDYTDRIVAPIGFITQSLSNPIYASQLTRSPSASLLASTIAGAAVFTNTTGVPYDPSQVAALVNNSNVNAGRQPVHGIDGSLSYRTDLGPNDRLSVNASASYLVSYRQISASQPELPLAGILFNPPHWRARGSIGWQHGEFGLTASTSYTGPLRDTRFTPAHIVPGQATVDLALRYQSPDYAPAALRGIEVILAAQNLFDAKPPLIATGPVTDTPYDSTNYSAIGRFVSLSIAKKW